MGSLGSKHLREGSSKALEDIIKQIPSISSCNSEFYKRDIIPHIKQIPLSNPYYLCNELYTRVVGANPNLSKNASLEEFISISDLALINDSWIYNYNDFYELDINVKKKASIELEKIDFTPIEIFFHLLQTMIKGGKRLNRIKKGYSQEDVANFQEELNLSAGGIKLSNKVRKCEEFIDTQFPIIYKHNIPIISKKLWNTYKKMFIDGFRWRREECKNGCVLFNLITSEKRLHNLLNYAPSLILNDYLISSRTTDVTNNSIGREITLLQQMHDITNALIHGNRACPYHNQNPRKCNAKPFSLCNNIIKNKNKKNPRCIREQTLSILLEITGIKKLIWKEN